MLNIINHQDLDQSFYDKKSQDLQQIQQVCQNIIDDVKNNGDAALIKMANQFDGANFKKADDLLASKQEIDSALNNVDEEVIAALKIAKKRIFEYHQRQMPQDFEYQDELANKLGNKWIAIQKIGIYVPGGTANYPSSVLMSAIPAIVAGAKEVSICVPSNKGKVSNEVLVAANLLNIDKIYKIGGAGAIAALTYGTDIISKVDKIAGPGNAYVAMAKKILFGVVGIDMIAGPTDVLVIADCHNNSDYIAADLLSQAEHGADSSAILITDNQDFAYKVNDSINKILPTLSRKEIAKTSLKNFGAIILVDNLQNDAANIANIIAPEHLQISCKNNQNIFDKITNAGAIFLGQYTPEAIGDYIAGPSHTLPTNATAKFASGLSVFDFLKRTSIINCSKTGFFALAKNAALIANCEGLDAHKLSLTIRKNNQND